MNIKKILLLTLFFFSISFFTPTTSVAVDSPKVKVSSDSLVTRIMEKIEYFFAFKIEKKVEVLEKQAENRLNKAQDFADDGNKEKVQNQLQSYLDKKEAQNNLLGKSNGEVVLKNVEERTIEQQKTMEDIKTIVDDGMKQKIIQVQEQVVNQVAQRVIDINGKEEQTEFFNKVEHVWAPGTSSGGEAGTSFAPGTSSTGNGGVVVKGGLIQFAPGTSAGGESGVKYEGGAGQQLAPGTSSGGNAGADIKNVEVKGN